MSDVEQLLTDLRFWAVALKESERTVVCPPDLESRVKGAIDAYGLGGTHKVVTSPYLPDGQIFILDENAIQAGAQEIMSRGLWSRPPDWDQP